MNKRHVQLKDVFLIAFLLREECYVRLSHIRLHNNKL